MIKIKRLLLVLLLIPWTLVVPGIYYLLSPTEPTITTAESSKVEPIDQFILRVMDTCKAKVSDGKKRVLVQQLTSLGSMFVWNREAHEAFVLLVCIESRFNPQARSKVGATGLSQIMPKYANEFAKECNLGTFDEADLQDSTVNLTIGACRFNSLYVYYGRNVPLALAAYNSGKDSPTVKKLSNLQEGHPETSGYIAKYTILTTKLGK